MTVYFPDGSWFRGDRKWYFPMQESKGTHHFIVKDGDDENFGDLVGRRVAVPINSVQFFLFRGESIWNSVNKSTAIFPTNMRKTTASMVIGNLNVGVDF